MQVQLTYAITTSPNPLTAGTADGNNALVVNSQINTVLIIDVNTLTVTQKIDFGIGQYLNLDAIAITPDGGYAVVIKRQFVSNPDIGAVSVLGYGLPSAQ